MSSLVEMRETVRLQMYKYEEWSFMDWEQIKYTEIHKLDYKQFCFLLDQQGVSSNIIYSLFFEANNDTSVYNIMQKILVLVYLFNFIFYALVVIFC